MNETNEALEDKANNNPPRGIKRAIPYVIGYAAAATILGFSAIGIARTAYIVTHRENPQPYSIQTPTPVPLSESWYTLDQQTNFQEAKNIYLAFRDLRFQTQLEMQAHGISDPNLVSEDLKQKYLDAFYKRLDLIPQDYSAQQAGDASKQAKIEAYNEVFGEEDKNALMSELENIALSNEPYVRAMFGDNGSPTITIEPSYVDGSMAYREGTTVVSVDALFRTKACTKQSLLHERVHYEDDKQNIGADETKTEARAFELLARMARDGDVLSKLALFASLENDAGYFFVQNAETDEDTDDVYRLNNSMVQTDGPGDLPLNNPFYGMPYDKRDLQSQISTKYNANVFGEVYPVIAGKSVDSGQYETLAGYVRDMFADRLNRIEHRDSIVGYLRQSTNLAGSGTAKASSYSVVDENMGIVFDDGSESWSYRNVMNSPPGIANDGDRNEYTCWSSGIRDKGQWWEVDLHREREIGYIVLTPPRNLSESSWLKEFSVLSSVTGEFGGEEQMILQEKNLLVSRVLNGISPEKDKYPVLYELDAPITTRYLRVVSNIPDSYGSICEFEVYGVP